MHFYSTVAIWQQKSKLWYNVWYEMVDFVLSCDLFLNLVLQIEDLLKWWFKLYAVYFTYLLGNSYSQFLQICWETRTYTEWYIWMSLFRELHQQKVFGLLPWSQDDLGVFLKSLRNELFLSINFKKYLNGAAKLSLNRNVNSGSSLWVIMKNTVQRKIM